MNGTLVLCIGETIEEVQDTGFLSSAPTLAVQQIGYDALLQVHPQGIRHVLSDKRVNEWRVPAGKTIVAATTNKRQVVVALSSAELVYFELDLDGQLNEYQDRKAMGSTVLALSIAEVPEGRQRTPYLVRARPSWDTIYTDVSCRTGCRLRGPDRPHYFARPREHPRDDQSSSPHRAALLHLHRGHARRGDQQDLADNVRQHRAAERRAPADGARPRQRAAHGHAHALPRHAPDPPCARAHPAQPRHPRALIAFVAELHLPEPHALHAAHLREPRLRVELLGGTVPGRSYWYLGERAQVGTLLPLAAL